MEMESPGFWDDADKANGKMKELKNLKDTVDTINALLTQYEDIETLIEMGYEVKEAPMGGRMIEYNQYLDLFENMGEPEGTVFIDGIQVDSLEKICQWKKARGREKDMADIKLIEEALR